MDHQQIMAIVSKTAALMEQFERRCDAIEQRQQTLTAELQQLVQQVPEMVRESADQTLSRVPEALLGQVRSGLEKPVDAYEKRLRDAGGLLHNGSQALASQLQRVERLHRQLMWKVLGTTLGSLLLLLAGGTWLSWQYRNDIRRNQVTAELLRAYNRADVTLCDGRLCANVDMQDTAAYGEQKQYRPVRPRP